MDTESRILQKEIEITQLKHFIHTMELSQFSPQLLSEFRAQLLDREKSLYHDRQVQIMEAQSSGRKTWKDDAWKYAVVIIVTSTVTTLVNQGIPYLFAHL